MKTLSRFKRYLGKLPITIDGEEHELEFTINDKIKFDSVLAGLMEDKGDLETKLTKCNNFLVEILKKSYPKEPEEAISAFVMKKDTELVEEISIALGKTTRKELEKFKKKRMAELEDETPKKMTE